MCDPDDWTEWVKWSKVDPPADSDTPTAKELLTGPTDPLSLADLADAPPKGREAEVESETVTVEKTTVEHRSPRNTSGAKSSPRNTSVGKSSPRTTPGKSTLPADATTPEVSANAATPAKPQKKLEVAASAPAKVVSEPCGEWSFPDPKKSEAHVAGAASAGWVRNAEASSSSSHGNSDGDDLVSEEDVGGSPVSSVQTSGSRRGVWSPADDECTLAQVRNPSPAGDESCRRSTPTDDVQASAMRPAWGLTAICPKEICWGKHVASGTFSAVYSASLWGTDVAVKVLKRDHSVEAYRREITVLMRIRHPYVLQIIGTTQVEQALSAIVTEMCGGSSLCVRIFDTKDLTVTAGLRICVQIAQACTYLHTVGCQHRDIKSQNVFLLTWDLSNPHAKLGDFGAACFADEQNKGIMFQGTVGYMAPESYAYQHKDRSDVYALGAVTFEAVAMRDLHTLQEVKDVYCRQHNIPESEWDQTSMGQRQMSRTLRSMAGHILPPLGLVEREVPGIGLLLKDCFAWQAENRPSASQLRAGLELVQARRLAKAKVAPPPPQAKRNPRRSRHPTPPKKFEQRDLSCDGERREVSCGAVEKPRERRLAAPEGRPSRPRAPDSRYSSECSGKSGSSYDNGRTYFNGDSEVTEPPAYERYDGRCQQRVSPRSTWVDERRYGGRTSGEEDDEYSSRQVPARSRGGRPAAPPRGSRAQMYDGEALPNGWYGGDGRQAKQPSKFQDDWVQSAPEPNTEYRGRPEQVPAGRRGMTGEGVTRLDQHEPARPARPAGSSRPGAANWPARSRPNVDRREYR